MSAPRCWLELVDPKLKQVCAVRWTDVLDITVEDTLYLAADSFEISLKNNEHISDWLRKELEVKIWLGYVKDPCNWSEKELLHIFSGKIDGVRPRFGMDMTVQILGRDFSAPLIDQRFSLGFAERTASQIAEELAAKHKLAPKITATTVIIERDLYKDKKDWEILQTLADREGFVCYVTKDKELYFGPRQSQDDAVFASYKYRQGLLDRKENLEKYQNCQNLLKAGFDDSMLEIYNKVIVRHWLGKNKQLIQGEAEEPNLIEAYGKRERIIYDSKAVTAEIAAAQATKMLHELSRGVVTADCTVVGDPALAAEKTIQIAGCGRFDQIYYIDSVRHNYRKSDGYLCDLKLTSQRPDSAAQYRASLYNEESGET